MRTLILGASGQVGALLYQLCARRGYAVGTYHRRPARGLLPLDLRDANAVAALVRDVRPAVCYLPAALTHMDHAEQHPAECYAVNVGGTVRLARALARAGGVLVLFSTDHVFGDSPDPRTEDDPSAPRSVYARSKLLAEQAAAALLPDQHLVLRTCWVYGPDPQRKNFFARVCDTLAAGRPLVVPVDQHGQPTYGPDLARVAVELVERGARGTFHAVGPRSLSRLSWARLIAESRGLPRELIEGRTTRALQPAAPRPLRVRLDRRKLLDFLGRDPIRPPEEALAELRQPSARDIPCVPSCLCGFLFSGF